MTSSNSPLMRIQTEALPRRELLRKLAVLGLGASALPMIQRSAHAATTSFPDQDQFIGSIESLLAKANSSELQEHKVFRLGPADLPWQALGMSANKTQAVTFIVGGRLWLSREHDLWIEPGVAFHVRSDSRKPMYNPMLNHGTMLTANSGDLEIARSMAEWENQDGELWTPEDAYVTADVEIYGVALKWKGDAGTGLNSVLEHGDVGGTLKREADRIASASPLPSGWKNHFNAGGEDVIFRSAGNGQISCHAHKTGGLLQHEAKMPLVPGTRVNWRWIIEELPSKLPEDQLVAHDYLSFGVEFDDGQDLTYMWSHSLPVGHVFRCPIPRWAPIETHMVVRTGLSQLGQWQDEERDVYADYQQHIAGDAKHVVRVWLLAVTIFQRRAGICRYENIQVSGPSGNLKIL